MDKEWSDYFQFICSLHSGEIAAALQNTECKTEEEKTERYYEQASLVVLRHFKELLSETKFI